MRESDVRETRPEDFKRLNELYGPFTMDACATLENAKCTTALTSEGGFAKREQALWQQYAYGDGLTLPWTGTVWCNPPYSNILPWVCKAWESSATATSVCMVVPNNRGEQSWWQDAVEPYRDGGARLVKGWNLTTHFQRKRWLFLKEGKPILDRNGKVGSARFGIVALVWRRA